MNNNNGAISFEALMNTTDFNRGRRNISEGLREISREAGVELNRFEGMFRKASLAVGAYFTFDAAKALISDIVKVRGEFQQLEIAFNTMLGSKAQADELMAQAVDFAAKTPFGLEATANATKQLLAYGESADTVFDTLRKLGDIASGLSIPLSDLAYLYGTTMTQGRLYTQDLNQFVGRGIPLIRELASSFGVAESEVKALVEAGKVGFPEVQKALDNLTKEGSMFGGLMEAQSKSLPGQIEQLKDAWSQMFNEIGSGSQGMIASSISGLTTLVQNYEQVGRILAALAITYGTYRAALMLTAAAQTLVSSSTAATEFLRAASSLGTLSTAHRVTALAIGAQDAAQRTLNTTLLANPYAAVAAAVVGLVAVIWALNDGISEEEKAQTALNQKMEEAKQMKDSLSSSVQSLINTIKDETKTIYDQIRAYDELIAKLPELSKFSRIDIQTMGAKELSQAVNAAISNEDIKKQARDLEYFKQKLIEVQAEKEKVDAGGSKATEEIKKSVKELDNWKTSYDDVLAYLRLQITELEKQRVLQAEAAELEKERAKGLAYEIAYHERNRSSLEAQKFQLEANLMLARYIGTEFDVWQQKLNAFNLSNVQNQLNKVDKILSGLNAKPEITTPKVNTPRVRTGGRKEEKFLEGSMAYYDKEIQKLQDRLKRLPVIELNKEEIKNIQDDILKFTTARAEAEKAIAIRTEDEIFEEKRKRYEAYEALVSSAEASSGLDAKTYAIQEDLKNSFSDLIKEGENWLQFLEKQKTLLDDKVIGGIATEADIFKLAKIKNEIATIKGESTPIENYKKLLEGMRNAAVDSAEAIKRLKEERAALDEEPSQSRGSEWFQKSMLLDEGIKEATEQAASDLRSYLEQVEGTKQKEIAIVRKYNGLIKQAEKEKLDTRELNEQFNDEIAQNYAEGLEAYKKMNALMGAEDLNRLKEQEENIKKVIQSLVDQGFVTSKTMERIYKIQQDNINKQADISYQNIAIWSQAIGTAGQELSQLEGILGNIGQLFASAAQSAQQFGATYANLNDGNKKNDNQAYASAAQAGVNLVALVIGAAQRRKAKRKQEEANTLQVQLDLNKALVEEIRLRTELSENVYITDYYGRITDSMNAMQEAGFKAFEAIQKLNEVGKAKNGTKNKIDWGAVGAGAGAGATIGAAIGGTGGTVIPVIGNVAFGVIGGVIGAIAGGLVGLFGAMKKDARYSGLFEVYPELISQAGEFNATLAQTLIANDQLDDKTKQYLQSLIDMNEEWKAARQQITDIVEELSGQMGNQLKDALVGAFEDGTNAATAFAGVVEDTLQNALESLIYSKVFSNLFDTLGTDLENALMFYGATGDLAGIYDAFGKFMEESEGAVDIFNEVMKAAKDYGKGFGLDLWDNEKNNRANGLAGQIQGVTEETASLIAGQMNAMRITTAEIDARMAEQTLILNDQLFHLANISSNSNYLQKLDRMDRNIDRLVNSTSARDLGSV